MRITRPTVYSLILTHELILTNQKGVWSEDDATHVPAMVLILFLRRKENKLKKYIKTKKLNASNGADFDVFVGGQD